MTVTDSMDVDVIQPRARGPRRLAIFVFFVLCILPVVLTYCPWRQNIPSEGRVVAFDPLDRERRIVAPVSGRIVKLNVQEGTRVKKGDVMIEMADLDPQLQARLEAQLRFAQQKLAATIDAVSFYDRQLGSLTTSRDMAITVARFELDIAIQKVAAADQALSSKKAELVQKEADAKRQLRLFKEKIASELVYQKAKADFEKASADVLAAEAKLDEARHESSAKKTGIGKVKNDTLAKIESVSGAREDAKSKVAIVEKEVIDAQSKLERQRTQSVRAPSDGTVLKLHGAGQADLVSSGSPLLDFVPSTENLAVELWVKGNDSPLLYPGAPVRIQFEGWPAIQFVAWPSVAQGTYGGRVSVIDSHDDGQGNFRILVEPDPDDISWPDQPFLRQGGRAKGWVMLNEVSLGYEIWRQLNGFPPGLKEAPPTAK